MNTQSHIIINMALFTRKQDIPKYFLIAALSGFIPDITMFIFVLVESAILRTPESILWNETYYEHGWQISFNILNSVPLTLILLIFGIWYYKRTQRKSWLILSEGMLFHQIADFFLHNDDGHAHLWPLTSFIFESPVSYWDRDHHGVLVGTTEGIFVLAMLFVLFRRCERRVMKILCIIAMCIFPPSTVFFFLFLH